MFYNFLQPNIVPLSETITFGFPANLIFSAEFTMTCKYEHLSLSRIPITIHRYVSKAFSLNMSTEVLTCWKKITHRRSTELAFLNIDNFPCLGCRNQKICLSLQEVTNELKISGIPYPTSLSHQNSTSWTDKVPNEKDIDS